MNRKIKHSFLSIFIIASIAAIMTFTSCASFLASVDDFKITVKEVSKYTDTLKNSNPDLFTSENKAEFLKVQAQIVDYLVTSKLIEKYASEKNITVVQKEIEDEIQTIKEGYATIEEYNKYLTDNNLTEEFLKVWVSNQLLSQKVFEKVTEGLAAAEEEVANYYEENKEEVFKVGETANLSHILVKYGESDPVQKTKEAALEKIKMVQDKLSEGEDFALMAQKYSEDENSNTNGGELGFFQKGQLVPEFEAVAFNLQENEISSIVETQYGFHIIKLLEKKSESITPFEDVKDSIKEYLDNNLKNTKWADFMKTLKDAAIIKYSKEIELINKEIIPESIDPGDTENTQEELVTPST